VVGDLVGHAVLAAGARLPFSDHSTQLQRLTPRVIGARDTFLVVHPDLACIARVRAVMGVIAELFQRDQALWTGVVPA